MKKWRNLLKIEEKGIVAVVRKIDVEIVDDVVDALVEGGIQILEITVDSENSYDTMHRLKKRYQDQVLVGAGTVLDTETAKRAIDANADFIFSPIFNQELIQLTNKYGRISIPGVFTPTEIVQAYSYGADILKVFPATNLGPKYFKDLQGPMGHIPLMPTGGVNLDNMADFIKSGAVAVGIGGALFEKENLDNRNFTKISELAKSYHNKFLEAKS
ncbi:MAG: bifunctional 4-hydroxy-2-oxoglutarate aldolase/2-dehydro-3-deoxy-phosphogluconate aldolase [Kurthia sp.]|nr:bifunctional 4-hydroxy-2-oxoglutarate aldolase/2-dehydro-3-deoxy-phosphogluconate aldolase [Candidatus Kurthia equi]